MKIPGDLIRYCKPLSSAIRKNNISMTRYFMEKGVRISYPSPTEFYWNEEEKTWTSTISGDAVQIGNGDLVSYLDDAISMDAAAISLVMVTFILDAGAVINFRGAETRESPLHVAVRKRRIDIITLLLVRGADPNLASDLNFNAPIIAAAKNGDVISATALVRAGANVNATITLAADEDNFDGFDEETEGFGALHYFAEHGSAEGVTLMLQEGAEIDAVTFSGFSPLLLVAKGIGKDASPERIAGACKCCQLLVDVGADVNFVRVLTADFLEFQYGYYDEARQFTALTYATELGAPALVSCLIELGARITHCTEHSYSLLMRAAAKGYFETLAILVAAAQSLQLEAWRAYVEKKFQDENGNDDDCDGYTALRFCFGEQNQKNCARCANILIRAGVFLGENEEGDTPLDVATKEGSTEIFKMLLVVQDDVDVTRLLETAVKFDKVEITSYLLYKFPFLDIDLLESKPTEFIVAGIEYCQSISTICWLAVRGRSDMLAVFCSFMRTKQIDEVFKCETPFRRNGAVQIGGNGAVQIRRNSGMGMERKYAYYNALTLALQHSDACAKVLIQHSASLLPPSPFLGVPHGQTDLPY